jgi:DNA-binding CsgD family transcriptional regulator
MVHELTSGFRITERDESPAFEHVIVLTPKEKAVLALLAEGYSYLNTAGQLDITINTVRNHVRRIYEKLGVHTKSEAVLKAVRRGLLA